MTNIRLRKWFVGVFRISSLLPFIWLLLLYLFAVRAWITLEHFPVPSLNDPKQLDLDLHYHVLWSGFPILIFNIPLWVGMLFASIKLKVFKKSNVILFVFGITLLLFQVILDPFDIVNWYLD